MQKYCLCRKQLNLIKSNRIIIIITIIAAAAIFCTHLTSYGRRPRLDMGCSAIEEKDDDDDDDDNLMEM
jgi:hypothetical protein